ncbi:MAG: hypothetical protein GF370_01325 [Candidatus Nealsonbacteria bacterium]|nr:hypothetical protein [Candidatus Nealsonbacteria bacterium]
MAGMFGLSFHGKNFLKLLKMGTLYEQHWSEEFSGISIFNSDSKEFKTVTRRGLFRANFWEEKIGIQEKDWTEGIGYCGPTSLPLFITQSKLGRFALAFSGSIINREEISRNLTEQGHALERGDDAELLSEALIRSDSLLEGFKGLNGYVKGAYTILLICEEGLYGFRSANGQWPLVLGRGEDRAVIATESGGFRNMGIELIGDVRAGEVVLLEGGVVSFRKQIVIPHSRICSFLWVYTSFPNAVFEGIPASLVRKKLGKLLAKKDIEEGFIPDIVAPVPASGRSHAIGYYQEFCNAMEQGKIKKLPRYEEVLLKYPYAGRSYTPQSQELRNREAEIKILESGESYEGKTLALIDDSIVRGTQLKTKLIPKLKWLGIREVHLRISNPELLSNCQWGKTTKKRENLLACRYPLIQERINFLNGESKLIRSLVYNSVEGLIKAVSLPRKELCFDCSLLPQA